jgi:hypothetical protein
MFVDLSAKCFQASDHWLDFTSICRAIRQPSPLIPSGDELEKFWEEIKSSSNSESLLGSERKKRDRELDDNTDDSSHALEGLSSGGATPEKRQRIEGRRDTQPWKR